MSPEWTEAAGISEVRLRMKIEVGEDGTVGSVRFVEWPVLPFRVIVPALRAVRQWKYRPGNMAGQSVNGALPVELVLVPNDQSRH